jgi:hypothetical protein
MATSIPLDDVSEDDYKECLQSYRSTLDYVVRQYEAFHVSIQHDRSVRELLNVLMFRGKRPSGLRSWSRRFDVFPWMQW